MKSQEAYLAGQVKLISDKYHVQNVYPFADNFSVDVMVAADLGTRTLIVSIYRSNRFAIQDYGTYSNVESLHNALREARAVQF